MARKQNTAMGIITVSINGEKTKMMFTDRTGYEVALSKLTVAGAVITDAFWGYATFKTGDDAFQLWRELCGGRTYK